MGFRKVGALCYCQDPKCHDVYEHNGPLPAPCDKLPCGHKIACIVFSGTHFKAGDEACDMINYLLDKNYIRASGLIEICEAGGCLEDGFNLRVPSKKRDED